MDRKSDYDQFIGVLAIVKKCLSCFCNGVYPRPRVLTQWLRTISVCPSFVYAHFVNAPHRREGTNGRWQKHKRAHSLDFTLVDCIVRRPKVRIGNGVAFLLALLINRKTLSSSCFVQTHPRGNYWSAYGCLNPVMATFSLSLPLRRIGLPLTRISSDTSESKWSQS